MSSPRLKPTIDCDPRHHTDSERCEPCSARDRLGADHAQLDVDEPHVLDLATAFIEALHVGLVGRATALCGHRRPDYRRGQTIGRERWSEVDLAWLCFHAPTAVREALRIMLAACGEPLIPERELVPALAHSGEEHSAALSAAIQAHADGLLTRDEYLALRPMLVHLGHEMQSALARLDALAPWKDQVAARIDAHRGESGGRR